MQSDVNRRRAERRKKARKRHLLIGGLVVLIVALITLVVMCFTVFFSVKHINVSGTKVYTSEQIAKASGLTEKNKLLTISEKNIENNIRKALPYVDNVEIERDFPNGVNILITDAVEYAFYKNGEDYFVISKSGYILKKQKDMPQNLFEICTNGINGNISEKAVYAKKTEEELVGILIKALDDNNVKFDKIDVKNIVQITINVEGRFKVLLGTKDNINEKIKHLAVVINDNKDKKGEINLSMWTPENKQSQLNIDNK